MSDEEDLCDEDPMPKRARLREIIAHLDEAIASYAAHELQAEPAAPCERSQSSSELPVAVMVGTSRLAREDPTLVRRIVDMINESYLEANRELLGAHASSYRRTSVGDVLHRLSMGDAGPRANRVLHLAFRGAELVGCCSSTFQPPWTPEGCGHWGLLVVKKSAQGTGVASALVTAAEARLARSCALVQIEYEFTPGHAYSERLLEWYEGKCEFKCVNRPPRRTAPPQSGEVQSAPTAEEASAVREENEDDDEDAGFGETEFRKCIKTLPQSLVSQQRPLHLRELRALFTSELAALEQQDGVNESPDSLVGKRLIIRGLQQRTDLNGKIGKGISFDAQSGRMAVELEEEGSSTAPIVQVRMINLEVCPVDHDSRDDREGQSNASPPAADVCADVPSSGEDSE
ncbi:hypothetical protein AB1Y20_005493 [Prymnesium parvum]|uniref:N-acetyltransferase domain-containing protein n=1 Tax=Prymnesium parvum TaxID=97485 RepID=A0AB34J670_PRYPA